MLPGKVGRVSVRATLSSAVWLLLVSVMVSSLRAPGEIVAGAKILLATGRDKMVSTACAGSVLSPAEVLKPPAVITLVYTPAAPVMFAVTVQVFAPSKPNTGAGMVPPRSVTDVPLAALVPAHDPPAEDATKPAGRLSSRLTLVAVVALGFSKVIVKADVPPSTMVLALNTLLTLGCPTDKVSSAFTSLLPPLAEVTPPTGMVLVYAPAEAARAFTVIWQLPDAGITPPTRRTLPLPPAAVNVPPQLFVAPGNGPMTNPDGKVSVKLTPVMAVGTALLSVMVRTESTLRPTGLGANDFCTSRALTFNVAVAAVVLLP